MTPNERKALAEQITGNPLFIEIMDSMEAGAIEALIYAKSEPDMVNAQHRVQAIRTFRTELEQSLTIHDRRAAPV